MDIEEFSMWLDIFVGRLGGRSVSGTDSKQTAGTTTSDHGKCSSVGGRAKCGSTTPPLPPINIRQPLSTFFNTTYYNAGVTPVIEVKVPNLSYDWALKWDSIFQVNII